MSTMKTFTYLAVSGVNRPALPCMHPDSLREVRVYVKAKWKALKLPPKNHSLFSTVHPSLLSSCSPPSLRGHQTPEQFVLNLTMQMFLWVTDFYSLEKIISAFPKIVLLY